MATTKLTTKARPVKKVQSGAYTEMEPLPNVNHDFDFRTIRNTYNNSRPQAQPMQRPNMQPMPRPNFQPAPIPAQTVYVPVHKYNGSSVQNLPPQRPVLDLNFFDNDTTAPKTAPVSVVQPKVQAPANPSNLYSS
jgi:hypothetical protein